MFEKGYIYLSKIMPFKINDNLRIGKANHVALVMIMVSNRILVEYDLEFTIFLH
jgi:hypothetical protein